MMSTIYYCWTCEQPIGTAFHALYNAQPPYTDTHYEEDRQIYFCSYEHWTAYRDIKDL